MLLPLRGKKINQRKKEKKQRKNWKNQRKKSRNQRVFFFDFDFVIFCLLGLRGSFLILRPYWIKGLMHLGYFEIQICVQSIGSRVLWCGRWICVFYQMLHDNRSLFLFRKMRCLILWRWVWILRLIVVLSRCLGLSNSDVLFLICFLFDSSSIQSKSFCRRRRLLLLGDLFARVFDSIFLFDWLAGWRLWVAILELLIVILRLQKVCRYGFCVFVFERPQRCQSIYFRAYLLWIDKQCKENMRLIGLLCC